MLNDKLLLESGERTLVLAEEPFYSIQGEGKTVGYPALFIRTAGCPVQCRWCDSSFTFKGGTPYTISTLVDLVRKYSANRVVFTGGEPMMQKNTPIFLRILRESLGLNVEVETSAVIPLPDELVGLGIQWNVSPKLPSAEPKKQFKNEDVKKYIDDGGVLKFVITSPSDVNLIGAVVEELDVSRDRVWLMPQSYTRTEQMTNMEAVIDICKEHGYNFSPRLHILVYDYKQRV